MNYVWPEGCRIIKFLMASQSQSGYEDINIQVRKAHVTL